MKFKILSLCLFVWWCLMPISTIFHSYCGSQFYWWKKPEDPGENHRPVASHWQTLLHNVVHLPLIKIRPHNVTVDCIGSCKSNYHTISTTMAPYLFVNISPYTCIFIHVIISYSFKFLSVKFWQYQLSSPNSFILK